jgi:antirestriction protein ArdC
MKGYTVFNVEQIDGLPAHYYTTAAEPREPVAGPHRTRRDVLRRHRRDHQARRQPGFLCPARDFVQMPPRESFKDAESYCATLAHEVTHWTAHPSRCARELGKRFGDRAYAAEELIAEMGSVFLCADLGSPRKCATTTPSISATG